MKTSHGLSEEQTRIYMSQLGTKQGAVYSLSELLKCHWCCSFWLAVPPLSERRSSRSEACEFVAFFEELGDCEVENWCVGICSRLFNTVEI